MIYKFYQQHIFPHLLNQVMQSPSLMDQRRELLLPIAGEVLEIGFGSGVNLPFYQNIDTLYALEPNADIYQLAGKRLHASAIHVQHIQASAEQLPLPTIVSIISSAPGHFAVLNIWIRPWPNCIACSSLAEPCIWSSMYDLTARHCNICKTC